MSNIETLSLFYFITEVKEGKEDAQIVRLEKIRKKRGKF
jgi:hypothetical protein